MDECALPGKIFSGQNHKCQCIRSQEGDTNVWAGRVDSDTEKTLTSNSVENASSVLPVFPILRNGSPFRGNILVIVMDI